MALRLVTENETRQGDKVDMAELLSRLTYDLRLLAAMLGRGDALASPSEHMADALVLRAMREGY